MKEIQSTKISQGGLTADMRKALPIIQQTIRRYSPDTFKFKITAGKENYNHCLTSLHHSGNAVDIHTYDLPDRGIGVISAVLNYHLQEELDRHFGKRKYTALYNDQGPSQPHIHIQFNAGERVTTPGQHDGKKIPSDRIA